MLDLGSLRVTTVARTAFDLARRDVVEGVVALDAMWRAGLLTPQNAANHPWRHVVSNLLGGSERGVKVELHSLELHADDVILLCSDGLTEMVTEDAIANVLRGEPNPRMACEKLVREANTRGGRDNITAIVARFENANVVQTK